MGRRWAAALAMLVGLLAGWPSPASAAGGRLAPVADRYEPGDTATLVGYTAGEAPDTTFYAYLRPAGTVDADRYIGELAVEETGHAGYQHLRVTLRFDVPAALEPGDYEVVYCDDECSAATLGDLGASPLGIGVDPARRVVREWPLDEPEIAHLAGDALLVGPGYQTTAGELRAPAPAPAPPPVAATPPSPPAPAPVTATPAPDDIDWRLPTALVLGAALGTALVLALWAATPRAGRAGGRRPRRPAVAGRG